MRYLTPTLVLALSLTASPHLLGQEGSSSPEPPPDPALKLACPAHVEVLTSAVQSLQVEINALRQELVRARAQVDSLRIARTLRPQQEAYAAVLSKALVGAGADPRACKVDNIITGNIQCVSSPVPSIPAPRNP